MKLSIVSSTHSQEYTVGYLEVESSVGNFVILEGHEPLLLIVSSGKPVIFSLQETPETFEKFELEHGGILKVTRTHALLIVNG